MIYCFFEEIRQAIKHNDGPQARLSTARIMTIATVATEFFTGDQQTAVMFSISHKYIPAISKSRFKRLRQISETLGQFTLHILARIHPQNHVSSE